jgi:hypothetical protein
MLRRLQLRLSILIEVRQEIQKRLRSLFVLPAKRNNRNPQNNLGMVINLFLSLDGLRP